MVTICRAPCQISDRLNLRIHTFKVHAGVWAFRAWRQEAPRLHLLVQRAEEDSTAEERVLQIGADVIEAPILFEEAM